VKYEDLLPEDQLLFKKSRRPKKNVTDEEEKKVANRALEAERQRKIE
jgi:hypothetical protein